MELDPQIEYWSFLYSLSSLVHVPKCFIQILIFCDKLAVKQHLEAAIPNVYDLTDLNVYVIMKTVDER